MPYLSGDHLDFRGADLSGLDLVGAYLAGARMSGCRFDGARGTVVGPVLVDEHGAGSLDGAELETWFAARGAESIRVHVAA
ncbi:MULTISPECIES: pentapeptide repeat-containing protein [Micromonospora]|uniref:pentapeptide repeat-containing protein n=1 Tax=Micromonospora TaxID=1873 RepID=UPI0018F5F075|nr:MULTISPECIES: pentapeptide repeat-containing protein [Micromonospora]